MIQDRFRNMLTSEEMELRRLKEYFEEQVNEENERERRMDGGQ